MPAQRTADIARPTPPPPTTTTAAAYPRGAVTGVVLAGGRGTRLGGIDKGLAEVAGRPMIEYVLAALEPQAAAVAINANRSAEEYARYGHPVLADRLEGFQGPLAGMASALEAAATPLVLFVPCDSPLVDASLGPRLYAALEERGANVAVAHDGERLHPVFVLVRRRALAGLHDFLARGGRKIDRWFAEESTAEADFSDLPDLFLNVNREEDRRRLEARLRGAAVRARRVPMVGFAGYSGSGKTTLATGVVRALAADGVRVAAVKHAHHEFDIDLPGKDSYELRRAGAVQTLVGSRRRWALVTETGMEREPTLDELVDRLDLEQVDLVLVEGFKHAGFPKIAVVRGEDAPPLAGDPWVVAIAAPGGALPSPGSGTGAGPGPEPEGRLPRLDLDRPQSIARFIAERFLTGTC